MDVLQYLAAYVSTTSANTCGLNKGRHLGQSTDWARLVGIVSHGKEMHAKLIPVNRVE